MQECRKRLDGIVVTLCRPEKPSDVDVAEIFRIALPMTDTIIVTALERDVEGDVYLDPIDRSQFKIVDQQHCDEEEPYQIIRYERI